MITMVDYDALYFFEMDNNIISCSKEVTLHKNALGKDVPFDLFEESDGTKRLLDFLPMLIDLKENSSVYVIDELDRSMHTLLTRALLNYYFRLLTPEKDAQLICTTHETYLLDDDMLRPDQFWFIRKNKGASSLYTMGNQRLRRIVSNAYLHGGLELKPKME
jgi:AAA15 family ATPase/GTPase